MCSSSNVIGLFELLLHEHNNYVIDLTGFG